MKKYAYTSLFLALFTAANAQIDQSILRQTPSDTIISSMNMDAAYIRPSLKSSKIPVALGGYVEANYQHMGTEGVSDGHQFQFRRLSIFMSSAISKRIKFMTEIEFEPSDREIAIEFAAVDVEFHPLVNLRGGIIVNPIGAFNQNHDGPKWEFTERPISATQMLPGTWSNAGFGLYGKYNKKDWSLGYEFYLSSGFDDTIILNEENRTFLPASKENAERFEEIASGKPLVTAKIAIKNAKVGELGLSYMGHVYNKFEDDGEPIDDPRRLDVMAVDFNTTINYTKTTIVGEFAWIFVDVPENYGQQFGNKQHGGFVDIVQPVLQRNILGWQNSVINLACRLEYVDYNVGKFVETDTNIGDDVWSVTPAISFRPTAQTVFRLNYRILKQRDIIGNPAENTAGINIGFSTYF